MYKNIIIINTMNPLKFIKLFSKYVYSWQQLERILSFRKALTGRTIIWLAYNFIKLL